MNDKSKIIELLSKISKKNEELNKKLIKDFFSNDGELYKNALFTLTNDRYDDESCLIAISVLIDLGIDVDAVNYFGENFIQNAMAWKYDCSFVSALIECVLNKKNVNHRDFDGNTILHTAIVCGAYSIEEIINIYNLLIYKGYSSNICNDDGENILDSIKRCALYSVDEINRFKELYEKQIIKKENGNDYQQYKTEINGLIKKIANNKSRYISSEEIIKAVILNGNFSLRDLLYLLTIDFYDEEICCLIVEALLKRGVNPNFTVISGQRNFIQNAIINGYSEEFIFKILDIACNESSVNKKLDINYVDFEGDNILFTAIKSSKYKGKIINLCKKLNNLGFDFTIKNSKGQSIKDVAYHSPKISAIEAYLITDIYNSYLRGTQSSSINKDVKHSEHEKKGKGNNFMSTEDLNGTNEELKFSKVKRELEKFGKILNLKNFISAPTIGRNKELKNLMISLAQDKKSPIIVGESGVGKTSIVEELAYRIRNNEVPSFLKDKLILEVNPSSLVAGCKYRGQFEEVMKELFEVVNRYDVILFIDEIHTIYGVGSSESQTLGMESIIKSYIDRSNVKIIGTTTDKEYQQYFAGDALKRRFEKIKVEEPNGEALYRILDKVIDDYSLKSGLNFKEGEDKEIVIRTIIKATDYNCRVYNDRVNNPDLAISIIDKAFAFAKYDECEYIDKGAFVQAFDYSDRIYESIKNKAIMSLKKSNVSNSNVSKSAKILNIDFTKLRR